jgi:hypothetical protein
VTVDKLEPRTARKRSWRYSHRRSDLDLLRWWIRISAGIVVFVDSLRWCDVAIVVRRYRLCEMDYRVLTLSRNSMDELLSMQAEGCYELRVYLRCPGQSETQRRERECDASYRGARTFQLSSHLTPVIVMPACPRVVFRAKFRGLGRVKASDSPESAIEKAPREGNKTGAR